MYHGVSDGWRGLVSLQAYKDLEARFRRIAIVGEAAGMLGWDSAVMMPAGGAEARAEQTATLVLLRHEMLVAAELADLLHRAEDNSGELDPWQAANLREMQRRRRHATAVPGDLVEAAAKASSASEVSWRSARQADDFAAQRPYLESVIKLAKEIAAAKADALGLTPYDAMLDGYEAGLRTDGIAPLFAELEDFLPAMLETALEHQAAAGPALPLEGPFPREKQKALGERLMATLGFDFAHGRLDESHHPFSGGVPEDARITTRYDEDDFGSALMAVLHETGHALYGCNLPPDWRYQPVGGAMGMVIHESQSLIVEMQACRSDAYLAYVAPLVREAFGASGPAWTAENLARHLRKVARGLIRVDADEVTYPLHVILRYRLERALLAGDLVTGDLPGAWNDGMAELVGIRPTDDRDGCLQDVHWYGGDFGYFPTYTLGALAAAQLFQSAARSADLPAAIEAGDFTPLTDWLHENVHRHGRFFANYDLLLKHVTGRPLDTTALRQHLENRYPA